MKYWIDKKTAGHYLQMPQYDILLLLYCSFIVMSATPDKDR